MIVVEEFDLGIIDFPQKVKSKEKDLHAMVTRFPFLPVAIARQRCEPRPSARLATACCQFMYDVAR